MAMTYEFTEYTFNVINPQENHIYAFLKNGVVYDFNILTFNPNFDYGNYSFYDIKRDMDSFVINNVQNNSQNASHLMYGYAYFQYEGDLILNLNKTECTHYMYYNLSDWSSTINGVRTRGTDYLTRRLGMQSDQQTHITNVNGNLNLFYTEYDYFSAATYSKFLFDYNLSNDNSSYDYVGSVASMYNSYFTFTADYSSNDNFAIKFGRTTDAYTTGLNTGRAEGYRDGYEDGANNAREVAHQEGYQQGYFDGQIAAGSGTTTALGLINDAFTGLTPILNIEVLPNITLGVCISIPIIIGLVTIIFKIAKG